MTGPAEVPRAGGARSPRRHRAAQVASITLGVLAGIAYSDYLIDLVLRPAGVDELTIVSRLEAPGAPYSSVLRAFDITAGVLAVALAPFLLRALPRGLSRWLPVLALLVFGVCGALTGIIPTPCPDPSSGCGGSSGAAQRALHVALSGSADAGIVACPALVALVAWRRGPQWVWLSSVAAFVLMVLAVVVYRSLGPVDLGLPRGLSQRLVVSSASLWLVVVGVIGAFGAESRAGRV